MNWRLFALGLIIAVVSSFAGGYMGHLLTLNTNKSNLEQMKPTLDKAIEKATNEITNEIKIDKIKKSDSIRIVMDPNNKQVMVRDTCLGIDLSKLTENQRKRLKRWLK
ncbi:hypothetical protein ACOKFD_15575 [Flagellimonas sp. S174]|uniref:hypothetical protein n=1 Tax=Flagellimonas sp. S174 TaxID=3410790 RepID=UPI003BF4FF5A